jgi:hypothetical protein
MKRLMLLVALLLAGALSYGRPAGGGQATWSDLRRDPAIQYDARPTHDPVAELEQKLQQGAAHLTFDAAGQGYLRSFLDALDIPIQSQVVAFSKTSFQTARITPSNPRAIYFSDNVAVGWVKGGPIVEIAAVDPQQGVIFYELQQFPFGPPRIHRADTECLTCHISTTTLGVPGLGVGSVLPDATGMPLAPAHTPSSDHRTPLEDRWGGWYVTGRTGKIRHLGNTFAISPDQPQSVTPTTGTLPSLVGRFPTDGYLSPYSDIAALMVLEHQAHMTNLLTRVGWETRARLGRANAPPVESTTVRELVDYMLFVDEAPLDDHIQGTSGFAEAFAKRGPRDHQGRSLRDLDLSHRLMRYPCSYMIYAPDFENLPTQVKEWIYRRMWDVLSGRDKNKKYSRLTAADRTAVREILLDTKTDLPAYFRR